MPERASPTIDSRFIVDNRFSGETEAQSSKCDRGLPLVNSTGDEEENVHDADGLRGAADKEQNKIDSSDKLLGLGTGMDPEGFAGPSSEKIVKPLTPEALLAFKAAQERTGVIYISRIPPGMQPPKVRHLMGAYGEIGRVYLQREGV
jgi:ESF2/ABP1 family protein